MLAGMANAPMLYVWSIEPTAGWDSAWALIEPDGLRADGRIVALLPEPHWLTYRLETDAELVTRRMHVDVRTADGSASVAIEHDGGRWVVAGEPRPDLDGALDVDLAACPLTNVMPIRRHALRQGPGDHALLMAFIEVPSLRIVANRQRYTHVRRTPEGGAIVRYASGTFRSDLTVDGDGFVLEYPRLGRRVMPGPSRR
jgi:uncharacterized protein